MRCALCHQKATGSSGHCIGEVFVDLPLCMDHLAEYQKDEDNFFFDYFDEILDYRDENYPHPKLTGADINEIRYDERADNYRDL